MYINLYEDSRNELVAKSKRSKDGGIQRYKRRLKSRVSSSVREYNKINMNQFFKDDIITIGIEVRGETSNYIVRISYGGVLKALREEIKRNDDRLELRNIIRALIIAFNRDDEVFISCSCPDWKYRFNYWATKNQINSGTPEARPSDITNPNDSKGSACKHVLLVLSNTSWLIKVASVINNYIKYFEKHRKRQYADIIYPAVYGKEYEEPVQLDMTDDELITDKDTIDQANIQAREKGRFKAGNKYRYTKKDISDDQISLFDNEDNIEEVDDEE